MNISLDFDETYTRDPILWLQFIKAATDRGHKVYCVTMRTPEEGAEVIHELSRFVEKIIFTSRKAKKDFCYYEHNINIDVWIDDMPLFVVKSALH